MTIVAPSSELAVFGIESHRHAIVAHRHLVVFAFHLEGVHSALCSRECRECSALRKDKLFGSLHITCFCPVFIDSGAKFHIEVIVGFVVDGSFQSEWEVLLLVRSEGRKFSTTSFHHFSIAQDAIMERKSCKTAESILVNHSDSLSALVVSKLHILIYLLEFGEFGCPFAFGGNDTIVHEVALVRTRIVVASGETAHTVLE